MIAFILEAVIAGTISYFLYDWHWWAATIAFPVLMMLGNQANKRQPQAKTKERIILDTIIGVVQFGYVASQAVFFHINIGHWYGWIIGLIVGWLLMGLMTPLRWRDEVRAKM
jgi:hypothetical protein